MSTNATSPATLFGGSWTKIEGRFLWATGSTPMTTGGSRTTDSTVLTIDQIPSHTHGVPQSHPWNATTSSSYHLHRVENNYTVEYNVNTSARGGGKGHTHTYMPPYFEVYMWYRTA